MKEFKIINTFLFNAVFLSTASFGQEIVTDRPNQTESALTVPKGSLQIESGILFGFTNQEGISERQVLIPTNLFRFGLTKGIELRSVAQLESLKNKTTFEEINGVSDFEIGTKVQLFKKEQVNTQVAFLTHFLIPIGSNGLTNEKFGSISKLAAAIEFGPKVGAGYNLGYSYFGNGKGNLTYSIATGFKLTEQTSLYIEPFGEIVELEKHLLNVDAGFTYLLRDNLQLDFSFGTGINNTMTYMALGFSWNIKLNGNQN
ncbi:MAG: transporter [Saprospiraceae bacterium]|jgi:hypothetical protein|nr:transporter [Saprospiraceae bacterium]